MSKLRETTVKLNITCVNGIVLNQIEIMMEAFEEVSMP